MRKLKALITIIIFLIVASFREENDEINIWKEQTKINKAIDFEKSINKKIEYLEQNVILSSSIYPLVDKYIIARPIIIRRYQTGFLPLYASYFYSEPDSIIRYISYDWEKERYGNYSQKQEMWEKESKKLKEYNFEYEKIKSNLIKQLGEPKTQDMEPQKIVSTSGRGDYLSRKTIWETDEYYSELNMIFESMTYRIRWYCYWKK